MAVSSNIDGGGERTPPDLRIYSVGDVHGRLDLLDEVANWIADDLARAPAKAITIFLGDYIDRGPHSAGVLERLSRGPFPTGVRALRGNHEQILIDFLDNEAVMESWRKFGGIDTLHSYGVPVREVMRGLGYAEARAALLDRMPKHHRDFLKDTWFSADAGDYFFCHAGVRPGVALDRQSPEDLMWIRGDFLDFAGSFGKRIIHGHTPVEQPDIRRNRINIDTGAYATGALTGLILENDTIRLFSTR